MAVEEVGCDEINRGGIEINRRFTSSVWARLILMVVHGRLQ